MWFSDCFIDQTFQIVFTNQLWWSKFSGIYKKQQFTWVLWKCSSDKFQIHRKTPMQEFFFHKVAGLQSKEKSPVRPLSYELCKIFQNRFYAKDLSVTVLLNTSKCVCFCLLQQPQPQNVTNDLRYFLIIFNYFQGKHCETFANSCFWKF